MVCAQDKEFCACPRVPRGTRSCLDCANVVNSHDNDDLPAGLYGLHAKSLTGIVRNTNASVWEMCERLSILAAHYPNDLKEREQHYGVKYIKDGLLQCRELRSTFHPIDQPVALLPLLSITLLMEDINSGSS